jgi:hypothetical protein
MIKPYEDNDTTSIRYGALDALIWWAESGRDLNLWLDESWHGSKADPDVYARALGVQKAIREIRGLD